MKKLLLLTLLPVFGLLLSNNCFATQHHYISYMAGNLIYPPVVEDPNNLGHYYHDFSATSFSSSGLNESGVPAINLQFRGSGWDTGYDSLRLYDSSKRFYLQNVSNQYTIGSHNSIETCDTRYTDIPIGRSGFTTHWTSGYDFYSFVEKPGIDQFDSSYSSLNIGMGRYYFPDGFNPVLDTSNNTNSGPCYSRDNDLTYFYDPTGQEYVFHTYTLNSGSYQGITRAQVTNSNPFTMKPSQSYGLATSNEATVSNGIIYRDSFDFNKMFSNHTITKFSQMKIHLQTWDGYFLKNENLYQGRELDWKFVFNFLGSFDWNPDVETNGSYIRLSFTGTKDDNTSATQYVDCTANLQVTNAPNDTGNNGEIKFLEIDCPIVLQHNYMDIDPYLTIRGGTNGDQYVWVTDSRWQFYSSYIVTDNNWEQGDNFNTNYGLPAWSVLDGEGGYNEGNNSGADWISSLTHLFVFGLPVSSTPLGLILGGFSNQESCASIPTIAGMINSNETQVCPFFPASVRSITTPVLALFSVCLVFGAFMSWLGGSSGNFIEDSSSGHTFKVGKHIGSVRTKGGK